MIRLTDGPTMTIAVYLEVTCAHQSLHRKAHKVFKQMVVPIKQQSHQKVLHACLKYYFLLIHFFKYHYLMGLPLYPLWLLLSSDLANESCLA